MSANNTNEDDATHTQTNASGTSDSPIRATDYEDAFELTGHGRFNHIVLVACCLIFMYCSLEMAGLAYVLTPAECDLDLTVPQKSLVNSGIFFGIVATSICWGLASDRFGRRKVMLPTIMATMLSSFLSSICSDFWYMFPLRILTGALVSAVTSTVLVYLSELHTVKKREFALSMAITSDQINFVILPGIAYLIIRGTWSFHLGSIVIKPWRIFMWFWCSIGLSGATILFFLPESPRFVVACEGSQMALPILAKIYGCNHGKKPADFPIVFITTKSNAPSLPIVEATGLKKVVKDITQLLRAPLRRCYIITHYCMFMTYLLANGLYIWMPAFINNGLMDSKQKSSICGVINFKYRALGEFGFRDPYAAFADSNCKGVFNVMMYPLSMGMETAFLVPYLLVLYLIDKVNLPKMYGIICIINGIGLLLSSLYPQIVVAILALIVGLCTGCLISILSALAVEAFPTNLRALAMCTMYMMGQVGAVVGVSIIGFMHGVWCHIFFLLIIGGLLLSAAVLVFLWPDTKKIREEMERLHFSY